MAEPPPKTRVAAKRRAGAAATREATALPSGVGAGIEALSGIAGDAIRVRRNSAGPGAATSPGSTAGAEQSAHLPHEAWHVVEQTKGRVKPTMQPKGGAAIGDGLGLEEEADRLGRRR